MLTAVHSLEEFFILKKLTPLNFVACLYLVEDPFYIGVE